MGNRLGGLISFSSVSLLFLVIGALCEFFEKCGRPVFDKGPAVSILDLVEDEHELYALFQKVG
jgi:hypothetical protein